MHDNSNLYNGTAYDMTRAGKATVNQRNNMSTNANVKNMKRYMRDSRMGLETDTKVLPTTPSTGDDEGYRRW